MCYVCVGSDVCLFGGECNCVCAMSGRTGSGLVGPCRVMWRCAVLSCATLSFVVFRCVLLCCVVSC